MLKWTRKNRGRYAATTGIGMFEYVIDGGRNCWDLWQFHYDRDEDDGIWLGDYRTLALAKEAAEAHLHESPVNEAVSV
jgi:hypothetical protein